MYDSPKEIFSFVFYCGLKDAINSIPDEETKDVHICKLVIDNLYDDRNDYDIKNLHIEYNTTTLKKTEDGLGGYLFIEMPFFAYKNYLDWKNQINYIDEENKEYEFSAIHFKNEMVELVKKLFEEKIILQKFGRNIAFMVECIEDEEDAVNVSELAVT